MRYRVRSSTLALVLTSAGCFGANPQADSGDEETQSSETSASESGASGGRGNTGADDGGPETTSNAGTADGGTDDGPGATGDDGPLCPGTRECVPQAPEGWSGPGAMTEALSHEPRPECPANFPEPLVEANSGLPTAPAACECDCMPSENAECATEAQLTAYSSADCAGSATVINVQANACLGAGNIAGGSSYRLPEIDVVSGTCAPIDIVDTPAAVFDSAVTICGGAQLDPNGCGNTELCAPKPSNGAQVCIWREGEDECPESYPNGTMLYRDLEDTRGCEPCSCGTAQGSCEDAHVRISQRLTSNLCAALLMEVPADGSCTGTLAAEPDGALLGLGTPTASCPPSEGVATGEVAGVDPITVCCAAD